jgi:hypothetical protein
MMRFFGLPFLSGSFHEMFDLLANSALFNAKIALKIRI